MCKRLINDLIDELIFLVITGWTMSEGLLTQDLYVQVRRILR